MNLNLTCKTINMKSIKLTALVLLLAISGCGPSEAERQARAAEEANRLETIRLEKEAYEKEVQRKKDLEMIKSLEYVWMADRINIYDAMNALAGIEGDVTWDVIYPVEYKEKPHLCVIIGDSKGVNNGKEKVIHIELLYNKNTGQSQTKVATNNGKAMNGLEFMMLLALSGAGWTSGSPF